MSFLEDIIQMKFLPFYSCYTHKLETQKCAMHSLLLMKKRLKSFLDSRSTSFSNN